jgi:hypothetical protein
VPLKQQRGHQFIKNKKKVRDNRENSARERSAEFGGTNYAPMPISLESTVGSCLFLYMW